jgi:hypothetical protein
MYYQIQKYIHKKIKKISHKTIHIYYVTVNA